MTSKTIFVFGLIVSISSLTSFAQTSEVKEKMAAYDFTPADGFKLTEKAVQTLELKFFKIKSSEVHVIPSAGLVSYGQKFGVYRVRGDRYKLITVARKNLSHGTLAIQTRELIPGDQIVISGVDLLHIADLDLSFSQGAEKEDL